MEIVDALSQITPQDSPPMYFDWKRLEEFYRGVRNLNSVEAFINRHQLKVREIIYIIYIYRQMKYINSMNISKNFMMR